MSARPASWDPLAAGDPLPGDPAEVQVLSRRYADTAAEILAQAATLRRLAGTAWDSQAGTVFAGAAQECADHLERAHQRYDAVSGAMRDWSGPLETAQDRSLTLLAQAREAASRQHQNAVQPVAADPNAPPPSAAQQQAAAAAERARQSRYADASADLAAARRQLDDLVHETDGTARRIASGIHAACEHDGLHDSWWDSVKAWVHDNAGWIKTVTEIISYIATALAVVALFVTGIGVLLVIGVMAAALAGHLLLAATGNGSWVDVGLDVLGMLTFGAGGAALKGAEVAGEELVTVGTRAASAEAKLGVREGLAAERQALTRTVERRVTSTAGRRAALARLQTLRTVERKAGLTAAAELRGTLATRATLLERLAAGDRMVPQLLRNAGLVSERFGPQAAAAAARAAALRSGASLAFAYWLDLTRHVSDTVGHVTGTPLIPEYEATPGGRW